LENQTLLSLAVALSYSSADFLELECEKLRLLVKEAEDKGLDFIQFIGKSRAKTSIQSRSHLTPEAIHCLSDYLLLLEKKGITFCQNIYGLMTKALHTLQMKA
jgi:hypothetical protein